MTLGSPYHNSAINVPLDPVHVRVELLLSSDKLLELDLIGIVRLLEHDISDPRCDVLDGPLDVGPHLLLCLLEEVEQDQLALHGLLDYLLELVVPEVHVLQYLLENIVNHVSKD